MKEKIAMPVFPGFYGTIFDVGDSCYENEIYNLIEEGKTDEEAQAIVDAWDYPRAYQACAKVIADSFLYAWKHLEGFTLSMKYVSLESPREYNYRNDEIVVEVEFNEADAAAFILKYAEEWRDYLLKRCTSYDGFWSHYSNDDEDDDWDLDDMANWGQPQLTLMLDFVCEIIGLDQMKLYEEAQDMSQLYEAFFNNV